MNQAKPYYVCATDVNGEEQSSFVVAKSPEDAVLLVAQGYHWEADNFDEAARVYEVPTDITGATVIYWSELNSHLVDVA
jgi:hypothetical protein